MRAIATNLTDMRVFINLTPFIPLSFEGEIQKGESKRGEASLTNNSPSPGKGGEGGEVNK